MNRILAALALSLATSQAFAVSPYAAAFANNFSEALARQGEAQRQQNLVAEQQYQTYLMEQQVRQQQEQLQIQQQQLQIQQQQNLWGR